MVENFSSQMVDSTTIRRLNLAPCSFCKPPAIDLISFTDLRSSKSVGVAQKSDQCTGITKKGNRCKHMTRFANGYCYQHTDQYEPVGNNINGISSQNHSSGTNIPSSICGAPTQKSGKCNRKVKNGEYCFQHR